MEIATVSYDLHVHSCLSPCADNDMTVNNIANMAVVCGLGAIALTDHNSLKNCPAFYVACARAGVEPVPGVEVCTREEVHVLCYFPSLASAMEFDRYLDGLLPSVANHPDLFGDQVLLNSDDEQVGVEARLLVTAADVSCDDLPAITARYGGVAVPAHIDRASFSLISNLGFVPAGYPYACYEVRDHGLIPKLVKSNPGLAYARFLKSSDAHSLAAIQESGPSIAAGRPGRSRPNASDIVAAIAGKAAAGG